jgi:hypothetical protein
MQEIRVELSQSPTSHRWELIARIGEIDAAEHLRSLRMVAFRGYLPPANRNYMSIGRQRYRDLRNFLMNDMAYNNPIPPQILTDAIKNYLTDVAPELTGLSHVSVVESEMDIAENLAASQPALLSIGGRMFRLSPTAESNAPTKMIDRMRAAASTAIANQREALLAGARREAQIIRSQAQAEREALELDRARLLSQQGNQQIVPEWLRGMPVKWMDGNIQVQLQFYYSPTKFHYPVWPIYDGDGSIDRHVELEWDANYVTESVRCAFWLPFSRVDGSYSLESAYMDSLSSELPHASHGRFCCQPQGLPQRIRRIEDLQVVIQAVTRTFKTVNLSSLLTSPSDWSPEVRAFMPESVNRFLTSVSDGGPEHTNYEDFNARVVERERATTIWQAPR